MNAQADKLIEREQEYKKLMSNQAELTRILDETESYVKDGICPTCGVDHETKINLIGRIRAQKEQGPFTWKNLLKLP